MMKTGDAIEIKDLNKWYGDYQALKNIDLNVAHGERIVVCGPSGSGKSTLIRCVNSLEDHDSGRIVVDGIEMIDNESINAIRSEVGMVFSAIQSVSAFDDPAKPDSRPNESTRNEQGRRRRACDGISRARCAFLTKRTRNQANFRVVNNSASRSHARSVWSRKSCFLTNPHRPLTQR